MSKPIRIIVESLNSYFQSLKSKLERSFLEYYDCLHYH